MRSGMRAAVSHHANKNDGAGAEQHARGLPPAVPVANDGPVGPARRFVGIGRPHQHTATEGSSEDGRNLWRGLRARVGIHVADLHGQPDPTTGGVDYSGPDVHRCATVWQLAFGGMIALTKPAEQIVRDNLSGFGFPHLSPHCQVPGTANHERIEVFKMFPLLLEERAVVIEQATANARLAAEESAQLEAHDESSELEAMLGSMRRSAPKRQFEIHCGDAVVNGEDIIENQ
jgi:hypothetical protein